MKVSLYNQQAEVVGDIELNPKIFEIKPDTHLMAESVYVQQTNSRKGLAHTKTRGEVRGGGKKPWRQKGTGNARAGSIRSPIWRHGGVALGPTSDRNWERKINKKAKAKALFMSLSDKAAHNKLVVLDNLSMTEPKTKAFKDMVVKLNKQGADLGKKFLFILPKQITILTKSARNLPAVTPILASSLNIIDVMKADGLLVLKDSLPVIEKTYLKNREVVIGKREA